MKEPAEFWEGLSSKPFPEPSRETAHLNFRPHFVTSPLRSDKTTLECEGQQVTELVIQTYELGGQQRPSALSGLREYAATVVTPVRNSRAASFVHTAGGPGDDRRRGTMESRHWRV